MYAKPRREAGFCFVCAPEGDGAGASAAQLEPHVRLGKLDTEAEPALAARFGIRSIPTMVLLHGGHERARQSGAMPAAAIVQWLRQHLPR